MPPRITINDIAKALNLSKTTVSFVLSGIGTQKGVSKLTQERILKYVKEINYRPNQLAQSLTSGITHTIGVVVPSIGDAFYAALVKEIELKAESEGYVIIISSSERLPERESNLISTMRAKQVDGLIIAPTEYSQEKVKRLLNDRFPFVLVDRYFPELDTNYVIVDDVDSTRRLIANLVGKGRRRIALITTDTKVSAIVNRLEGYKTALAEVGIPFDPALYVEVPRNEYGTHIGPILQNFFARNPDVDGMLFTAHYLASATMLYMYEKRMNIAQYGLASFHDNPIVSVLSPHMSIARIPLEIIGKDAVDLLIDDMDRVKGSRPEGRVVSADIRIND